MSRPVRVVPVEILGQQYPIKSDLDQEYVAALAAYVDQKVRAAATASPAADSLRAAVLAALNIADELFRTREAGPAEAEAVAERVRHLERLIDEAMASALPPAPPAQAWPPPAEPES